MARKTRHAYHCGICGESFTSKAELSLHTQNHAANDPSKLHCQVCNWEFNDSLSFETHKITSGHNKPRYSCDSCGEGFVTQRRLDEHMRPPYNCPKGLEGATTNSPGPPPSRTRPNALIQCDRCVKTFQSRQEYNDHRSYQQNGRCADHNHKTPSKNRVGYIGSGQPKVTNPVSQILGYPSSEEPGEIMDDSASDTPTDLSDGEQWCRQCRNRFSSMAKYIAHSLWCTTKYGSNDEVPVTATISVGKRPPQSPRQQHAVQTPLDSPTKSTRAAVSAAALRPTPLSTPSATVTVPSAFTCDFKGCKKTFRSEAGLKVHKMDAHGIGGKKVEIMGKDSWMLTQRMREQLKAQGILQPPAPGPSRRRGQGSRGPPPAFRPLPPPTSRPSQLPHSMSKAHHHSAPAPIPPFGVPLLPLAPNHHAPRSAPLHQAATFASGLVPTSQSMGGAFEMEQAKHIQGKILRLLIQSDIFIHHDGRMTVCGIGWTRIGVQKQPDAISMFDGMCHLPKIVQGEYLPPPEAFLGEYKFQYPSSDFQSSPSRDPAMPGLGVVALSCSKVVLADGLQEVVKIAAVDLITCRILMNHLVCTAATAKVADWRSSDTGLFSWADMEQARQLGYKIFKGWTAARSALWKFVDKDTIIVGHNLRSDLDALRMIHGRAVDIAKVAEKAAKGPLSKIQLSLDSLCRNYAAVTLKNDPEYGRDILMNAFAAHEMGLWVIKNKDKFERDIRQKSLDYQVTMPRAAAA